MSYLFGGQWTNEKLEVLRKYLIPYATILSKQPFQFAYIDAFAGTGYRSEGVAGQPSLFPELETEPEQRFIQGSAHVALQVEPPFQKYIFIEKNEAAIAELQKLKDLYPHRADRIEVVPDDANRWFLRHSQKSKWSSRRAVVFLDPFGMQVEWQTIEAIASTEAIDLWVLFPLGVAVNRLLKKDGQIRETWRSRLDTLFGTNDWYDVFYRKQKGLFGMEQTQKVVNLEGIGRFYNERLKEAFEGKVAENPRLLYNSRNNPLYLFCFAAGNPRAAPTALKIA